MHKFEFILGVLKSTKLQTAPLIFVLEQGLVAINKYLTRIGRIGRDQFDLWHKLGF